MFVLKFLVFVMSFVLFFMSIYGFQITALANGPWNDYVLYCMTLVMSIAGPFTLKN